MDFSEYQQLPVARVSKVQKSGNGYAFTTRDATDRINRPLYSTNVKLGADVLSGTTVIAAGASLAEFPASGKIRIGKEIISYASIVGTNFSGCTRGEFGTTAEAHAANDDIYLADVLQTNPIDIMLAILTSGSGSGDYDTLASGLALDPSLIDVALMEEIRDELFSDVVFSLALSNIPSALKFLETEILAPCKLRFTNRGDLFSIVALDKAKFVEDLAVIDHDTLLEEPSTNIQESEVQNKVTVNWNYDEQQGKYLNTNTYSDEDSINTYGVSSSPLNFSFKGVRSQGFVDAFAQAMLDRYARPFPEISCKTQMDKSQLTIGDPAFLVTDRLPNSDGELNFADTLEIVSRAINWANGDVTLKLAYTSFTGLRLGYIAPSDKLDSVDSQSVVNFEAGRGEFWRAGWKVRLWNNDTKEHEPDDTNEIASIDGDEITFTNAWSTTLTTDHYIVFPDYDEATSSQRRYAFVSPTGADFSRTEKAYSIVP
jgi:hypothetical protein